MLEDKYNIPMVYEQITLIQDLQTAEWWQGVTLAMLESVRRRLRDLVKFIDKAKKKIVYSDFEDEIGSASDVVLPGFQEGTSFERFRAKAQAFLRAHQDHITINMLRMNRPLTATDLEELERILIENKIGAAEDIKQAAEESHGLGLFVRSLVGMDREAAKDALSGFMVGKTLSANQIEFVSLIINHLTAHGLMETRNLYQSPFTDLTPRGPEAIFKPDQVDELVSTIAGIRKSAVA